MHHVQKAVGWHLNTETIENCSGFPQSLYTPAGAISSDKTRQLASKFMFIFSSFRDFDTHELIWESRWNLKKSYVTGNRHKNFVFKQTEK